MDCIDLSSAQPLRCRPIAATSFWIRTRKANDKDEELQNLIGEFNSPAWI